MATFDDLSKMILMGNSGSNTEATLALDCQFRQIINKSNNTKEKIPVII